MSQSEVSKAETAEERSEETRSFVRTVKAATRRKYTPEEKVLIVLEGFRREVTVNDLCRREGIKLHSYYSWTREFMEVLARRGLPVTRCGTPLSMMYRRSSRRTGSSSSWWLICHWRHTVSKKRPFPCPRTPPVPADERR